MKASTFSRLFAAIKAAKGVDTLQENSSPSHPFYSTERRLLNFKLTHINALFKGSPKLNKILILEL